MTRSTKPYHPLAIALGIGMVAVVLLSWWLGPTQPAQARNIASEVRAVCERAVKMKLRAPSTAQFVDDAWAAILPWAIKDGRTAARSFAEDVANGDAGMRLNDQLDFLTLEEWSSIVNNRSKRSPHLVIRDALERKLLDSGWLVLGEVDAQNAYGAMLRNRFICVATSSGTSWTTNVALVNGR